MFPFWKSRLDEVSSSVEDLPTRSLDFQIIGPQDYIVRILISLTYIFFSTRPANKLIYFGLLVVSTLSFIL